MIHAQSPYYEESDKTKSIGQFKEFKSRPTEVIRKTAEEDGGDDDDENEGRTVGLMEAMTKNNASGRGKLRRQNFEEEEEEEEARCCVFSRKGNK